MKMRLSGAADLVRAWSAELERAYGIKGAEYPSHAVVLVGLPLPSPVPPAATVPAPPK